MPDLILRNQDRVVDVLRQRGPMHAIDIAEHFDWPLAVARETLARLERRHLIQGSSSLSTDPVSGMDRRWAAID